MQKRYFTFFYITLFKYLTIYNKIMVLCFHFSKLILLICETMGFRS